MMLEETNNFSQEIIQVHNIARKIEREIGHGQLSEDLRDLADRLNQVVKSVVGIDDV